MRCSRQGATCAPRIPLALDEKTFVAAGALDRTHRRFFVARERTDHLGPSLVSCGIDDGACSAPVANVESGTFQIQFVLRESSPAVRALMKRYARRPMDLADACLVHLADLLGTGRILTLDGDFAVYRWRRTRPFVVLLDR